ncbi:glycoside hydrolase domain-containing protein [Streptomyces sp. NPDC002994]|uniref:glycoside hydrolase domain-containing protein n=1 Tax=Streptomyces sp. NPDC002994 TaxID=3154441 RepID=UPI0033A15129
MADERVLEAQKWVNSTYSSVLGYKKCPEDGKTGWGTMYSLTHALQYELGITNLSNTFGPTTLNSLTQRGGVKDGEKNENIVKIIQSACYCKGFDPGGINGTYGMSTRSAISVMMTKMGIGSEFDTAKGYLDPKVFKALLTMDAYTVVSGGTEEVRTIQQWFNSRYWKKSPFFIIPCDGHYTRDVQQAVMKALQLEMGFPEESVTGNFGTGTQAGLKNHTLSDGSTGIFVQLFSAACVFNGKVSNLITSFKSTYDAKLAQYVSAFQSFSKLSNTDGRGDYDTWCQLLVSMGNPDRKATACDTRFTISLSRAKALKAAGYDVVGRYLDEEVLDPKYDLNKELMPGELDAIFDGGMKVFPISQYIGRYLSDFTYDQGFKHAVKAHDRAEGYKFNRGTVIYFAVDYDATSEQIASNIVPYFTGVQAGLNHKGKKYIAGVYGSRNVCSRVSADAHARHSFVSGMSWGFSGNLGFPMPENWSFAQIKEYKFDASGDKFDLDRDVMRGTDPGVGRDGIGDTGSPVDSFLKYIDGLYQTAVKYNSGNASHKVLEWLRYPSYYSYGQGWETLIGEIDMKWINYCAANGPARVKSYTDPSYGVTINADHLAACADAYYLRGVPSAAAANRGDFAGWGGDLTTFYADWRNHADSYASGYLFAKDRLAKINVASSFGFGDLIEDADGYLLGKAVKNGTKITDWFRSHLGGAGHLSRFTKFFNERYNGQTNTVIGAARTMLVDVGADDELDAIRTMLIRKNAGVDTMMPGYLPGDKLNPFLSGYADTLKSVVDQESKRRRAFFAKSS